MLFLGVFFLGLWLAGLVTSYTMGGFIHVLAILATMALLSCMIRGGNSKRLAELTASNDVSGAANPE
ncbi:MAG TPA: DUF5670 family protein [Terriglobales bacterium]|jgi:hypothetical protein|nr:DUF5670 family protein [Terriglobales bacterium]